MDINGLKQRLKSSELSGVYIFGGEEEYLVRHYLSELRRAAGVDEAFAVFNNPVFDGEEVDFSALAEAVKAPPMMADYKLIEWRHADFSSMKEKELSALEELVALTGEYPYAVLAFTAIADGIEFGTPKRPSSFMNRFSKTVNILKFDRSTDAQLFGWLKRHFDAEGVAVTPEVLRALVFRSGHSMDVLFTEVKKLSALAKARGLSALTADEVNEVASSTPECDTFALSNAIMERNRQMAYSALEEMKVRRVDPTVIMGMIAKAYDELLCVAMMLDEGKDVSDVESALKISPYRMKLILAAVKRYGAARLGVIVSSLARVDARSKFGGVTGYTALELFLSKYL